MKTITTLILAILISIFVSCAKDPVSSGDCAPEHRTGAVCNDGTTSTATGSGACSHHGGVKRWLCD